MPENEPERRPDALIIPSNWGVGETTEEFADSICTYAEKVLGGDRAAGVTAHSRAMSDRQFITLNPFDTMFHEYGHPRETQPRYTWETRPDGAVYGYLTPDATPARPNGSPPPPPNPIARMMAEKKWLEEKARA